MNVYLSELDSARSSDREIEKGQWALFHQIEHNGTTVVLSMNQLTDSIAFTNTLWDEKCYHAIVSFFDMGRIKVSQYGNIWTASQYLQNAFEKGSSFKFGIIPIRDKEIEMFGIDEKQLLLESLRYSDLNRLIRYKESAPLEEKQRIDCLYRYIKLILHISTEESIWVLPKTSYKKLADWIVDVCARYESPVHLAPKFRSIFEKTRTILLNGLTSITPQKVQSRSEWYNYIKDASSRDGEESLPHYRLAEAVVDICYNLACEGSISDLDNNIGFPKFEEELSKYWDTYCMGHHLFNLDKEKSEKRSGISLGSQAQVPPFHYALEILDDVEQVQHIYTAGSDMDLNEKLQKSKKQYRKNKLKSTILRLCVAVCSIVIFVVLDFTSNWAQERINVAVPHSDVIENMIMSVIFGILLAVVLNSLIPLLTRITIHSKTYEMDYLDVFKHLFSRLRANYKIKKYNTQARKEFEDEKK